MSRSTFRSWTIRSTVPAMLARKGLVSSLMKRECRLDSSLSTSRAGTRIFRSSRRSEFSFATRPKTLSSNLWMSLSWSSETRLDRAGVYGDPVVGQVVPDLVEKEARALRVEHKVGVVFLQQRLEKLDGTRVE